MRVIANMIGRNEGDRYLADVLQHLQKFVDLIVFTDDASTDDTFLIARDHGASVLRIDEPLFGVDESRLRSYAWDHLSFHAEPNDWVLAIDCDEKLYGWENLALTLPKTQVGAIGIFFYHMWSPTKYRVDKAWRPDHQFRLFRFMPDGHFRPKRLACGSTPTYVNEFVRSGRAVIDPSLRMQHLGYMRDDDKLAKYDRYMALDGGRYHSLRHLESIVDPNPVLVKWDE